MEKRFRVTMESGTVVEFDLEMDLDNYDELHEEAQRIAGAMALNLGEHVKYVGNATTSNRLDDMLAELKASPTWEIASCVRDLESAAERARKMVVRAALAILAESVDAEVKEYVMRSVQTAIEQVL